MSAVSTPRGGTWVIPKRPHANMPLSLHAQCLHCAFEQIRKMRPSRQMQAPAQPHQGTQHNQQNMGWISTSSSPLLGGRPCAVNNLHDPTSLLCANGKEEWFGQHVKNGCTSPSLADMPISDGGVCLRAKLPPISPSVHFLGIDCTLLHPGR